MPPVAPATRLSSIGRLAGKGEADLAFLASLTSAFEGRERGLDGIVHEITRCVSAEIDCMACANCCRRLAPGMTRQDVHSLARHLGLTRREFEERYVVATPERDTLALAMPCPFLSGSECSVYERRPQCCREFPHLLEPSFLSRSSSILAHATVCPIVFSTLERLRSRLGFRRVG
jgi:hypothetical protein